MDKTALYRIKVKGVFPDSWSDRIGDLQIVATTSEVVTFEGRLSDQAALSGVLDIFYRLHLPILEVVCLMENAGSMDSQKDHESKRL